MCLSGGLTATTNINKQRCKGDRWQDSLGGRVREWFLCCSVDSTSSGPSALDGGAVRAIAADVDKSSSLRKVDHTAKSSCSSSKVVLKLNLSEKVTRDPSHTSQSHSVPSAGLAKSIADEPPWASWSSSGMYSAKISRTLSLISERVFL